MATILHSTLISQYMATMLYRTLMIQYMATMAKLAKRKWVSTSVNCSALLFLYPIITVGNAESSAKSQPNPIFLYHIPHSYEDDLLKTTLASPTMTTITPPFVSFANILLNVKGHPLKILS